MLESSDEKERKTGEIILTLADHTNEMGAGSISADEIPARPKSRTSIKKDVEYKKMRTIIMGLLAPRLKENDKYVHEDGVTPKFIEHVDGVVNITVAQENWHRLNTKQYKIAQS